MDVVAYLFSLISEHCIRRSGCRTLHQIGEETVQFCSRMIWSCKTTSPKAYSIHSEVSSIFLNKNVGGQLGCSEEAVKARVDAHLLGNSLAVWVSRGNLITRIQFDEWQVVGSVTINLVRRGKDKSG